MLTNFGRIELPERGGLPGLDVVLGKNNIARIAKGLHVEPWRLLKDER